MKKKFPGQVDSSGSTAFRVHSGSVRVDADVVPCFDYRYYFSSGNHRVDPATAKQAEPKTVYLVVQQTGSLVVVKLLTDESRSISTLANVSEVDGTFLLRYLYLNKSDMRVEHRSRIHHGSAVFDISDCPARRLKGRYWTDRDSRGELEFLGRSKKLADDFVEAGSFFEGRG